MASGLDKWEVLLFLPFLALFVSKLGTTPFWVNLFSLCVVYLAMVLAYRIGRWLGRRW